MDSNSALKNTNIGPNTPIGTQNNVATSATPTTAPNTDLVSKVNTSPTIDSSKLIGGTGGGNKDVTVPPASPDTSSSLVNSLVTGDPNQGLVPEASLIADQNKAQGAVDQTTQQINDLMTQLGMKSSDTASLQSQANITGLQNNLNDLNTQFAQKKAQYAQEFQNIGAQNIPTLFTSGQLALAKGQAATDLGSMAAQIQAAQGNLTSAFNTINQTIAQKYQPIQDQIAAQQKFYDMNFQQMTNAQQKLATRQSQILGLQQTAITNQQKILGDAATSVNDAIKNGMIDPATGWQVYSDLLSGKITASEAFNKLGIAAPEGVTKSGNLADAISSVESGGSYTAVGRTLTGGENAGFAALGKYQIMPNIWFKTIGLDPNSESDKQKFLNTPSLQDNLFQTIVSTLTAQHSGDQSKAIAAYFGGDAGAQAYGTPAGDKITDGNMSINQYVNKVLGNLNEQNAPSSAQYGLLSGVQGFNPQTKADSNAFNYLQTYFNKGVVPTATDLGLPKGSGALASIQKRANDLYFQATGSSLPNALQLKSNNALISANNKLENNLNIQEGTVGKNFKLAIDNIDKNGINGSIQPINAFLDMVKNTMGDPATAQYLTQNGTLQNEVGSLIAIKNASGTTVADKLASAGLIPKNASEKQQKAILKTLLQEAQNGFETIKQTSGNLYTQIDPLELNPNNPNRQASTNTTGAGNTSDITSLRSKYGY